ncbi:hypothetical protein, partial [Bacteroides finegoldii]|uniref:hypothetical protein n=1 Tax=Bacteroides finegoldii TaxID=338188 RepID=UPI001E318790
QTVSSYRKCCFTTGYQKFKQMKLKVQAGETKGSSRGNWSFKRGKLKFHTQETLGEKQDGKDCA